MSFNKIPFGKSLSNVNIPGGSFTTGLKILIGLGGAIFLGTQSFFTVEGGHRAVMFSRISGVKDTIYTEGMHLMIPWFNYPTIYSVRTKPRTIPTLTGSKDLQMVNITLRVLSKPEVGQLPNIHKLLGPEYDEKVLPSIANEVLKGVVAQFNASELVTQREGVSQSIRKRLIDRAREFNILLDDVSITHLSFSREYEAAVEAKQVAQQDAERARFVVEKALQDKRSTIIRAQGEARSARMISDVIRDNPNFLELRKIEAARDIAQVVSRSQNKVYLNADNLLFTLLSTVKFTPKEPAPGQGPSPADFDALLSQSESRTTQALEVPSIIEQLNLADAAA